MFSKMKAGISEFGEQRKGAWLDSARSARSVQLIRYQLIGKVEFKTINQKLMKSNPSFYLLTF